MVGEAVITAENLDLTFQTNDGPVQALKDVMKQAEQYSSSIT